MAVEHIILFGIVEGLITMLVLGFFLKGDPGTVYAMQEVKK